MKRYLKYVPQAVFGIAGITLVWIAGGWMLALGLFLCLWGNNMAAK